MARARARTRAGARARAGAERACSSAIASASLRRASSPSTSFVRRQTFSHAKYSHSKYSHSKYAPNKYGHSKYSHSKYEVRQATDLGLARLSLACPLTLHSLTLGLHLAIGKRSV